METKAEKTRALIIEKAAHLFNKKGFHGTSMSDILEVTRLAKGGVYGHFKSKEDIIEAAFDYSFTKVISELVVRIRVCDNAIDKLFAIIDYYYNYTLQSPIEGGCPILNYSSFADDSLPNLKQLLNKASRQMLDSLVQIIEKGQKYNQIKPSIQATLAADILYSRIEGAIMLSKATGDPMKLNRLLDELKSYIISTLKI
jgi:TetR/AcrR family transcriptional repressor of nem operon